MARPAVLVAIAALALAGCGSESHPAGETTGELVVSVEPAEFPDHLEDTECFAAVPGVAVLAESNGPPAVCEDVAARVLQGRERLSMAARAAPGSGRHHGVPAGARRREGGGRPLDSGH
jgi:hypothetical protein